MPPVVATSVRAFALIVVQPQVGAYSGIAQGTEGVGVNFGKAVDSK